MKIVSDVQTMDLAINCKDTFAAELFELLVENGSAGLFSVLHSCKQENKIGRGSVL